MAPCSQERDDRAQTSIDFVVGVGVFLLAVAFVLAFVPSMFAPFFGMGAGDALTADRSAAYLAENALVEDPSTSGALDRDAVDTFFHECSSATLAQQLGVGTSAINVTIGNRSGTEWACGDRPAAAETVSNRIVTINENQYTLRVVVW